jgi:hypothetical protein
MSELKKDGRGGVRPNSGRPKGEPSTMVRIPLGLVDVVKQLSNIYREQQKQILKR